ncbi:helix-turn-helix domain-containing protein [Rhodococcus sp. NPDC127528]|uniref:helix-turn-helix domain-containing protein n=1 Tax=unclassified Rhodococcus (in: high G+C Gram-positive bacteria) TaxID=192944 RepID=UPI00362EA4F8
MDTHRQQSEADEVREAIGRQMRSRRAQREMTQADLAQRTGISAVEVDRLERGERDMEIPEAVAIAAVFETTAAEFLQSVQDSLDDKSL